MTNMATRTAFLSATAAVILAASAGVAAADSTAPATTTSQQQTGATAPGPVLTPSTSEQSNATKTETSDKGSNRVWIKRAERGTASHERGNP